MKLIKEIIDHMYDTLEEAREYAIEAAVVKDTYPQVYLVYHDLAENHLDHYNRLHSAVVSIIGAYRKEKGEPPADMQAIWDYEHKKAVEMYTKIKGLL